MHELLQGTCTEDSKLCSSSSASEARQALQVKCDTAAGLEAQMVLDHCSVSKVVHTCRTLNQNVCAFMADAVHSKPCNCCRWNVMQQRAWRLSMLHWQHCNLSKVFQRWKEYKGRRAGLFAKMLGLATKWEKPLLEDAWSAWLDHVVKKRQDKVGPSTPSVQGSWFTV